MQEQSKDTTQEFVWLVLPTTPPAAIAARPPSGRGASIDPDITTLVRPASGFLLVGNHRSDFDPITAMWALRKRGLTFVTKKENVDIPVGGRIIVGSGCLSLDRSDDKQGLMVIRQAVRRIRAGDAIGIYPEGTRSKTGELLPFRVGCFKAAQWAKCPLVVLKVENSELVEKNFLRRKTTVRLTVKAVLPYDEIADMDTAEIGERVRNILLEG